MNRRRKYPSRRKTTHPRCRVCRQAVGQVTNGLCDQCKNDPGTIWLSKHQGKGNK